MVINVILSISILMPCWTIFEVLDSISCSQPEEDILTRRYLYFNVLMIWCVLQPFKETQHNIAKLKMLKSDCLYFFVVFLLEPPKPNISRAAAGSCSWSDCASTSCSCSSFSPSLRSRSTQNTPLPHSHTQQQLHTIVLLQRKSIHQGDIHVTVNNLHCFIECKGCHDHC